MLNRLLIFVVAATLVSACAGPQLQLHTPGSAAEAATEWAAAPARNGALPRYQWRCLRHTGGPERGAAVPLQLLLRRRSPSASGAGLRLRHPSLPSGNQPACRRRRLLVQLGWTTCVKAGNTYVTAHQGLAGSYVFVISSPTRAGNRTSSARRVAAGEQLRDRDPDLQRYGSVGQLCRAAGSAGGRHRAPGHALRRGRHAVSSCVPSVSSPPRMPASSKLVTTVTPGGTVRRPPSLVRSRTISP